MVKLPRPGRMAIVAGLGAVALLGTAAQSASAAPAPTPRAAVETISAPTTPPPLGTTPQKAKPPLHPMSSAGLNCVYEVVTGTEFYSQAGRQTVPLDVGSLLWGPQANVIGQQSAFLYSYTYDEWGWVWTGALYEQYCDP